MLKRNTKSKQAVLELFISHQYGIKPDELIAQLPDFDKVTIYRILNSFLEDGIIHKAVSDDGSSYYFICKSCKEVHYHSHYHFKCSKCQKVECIEKEIEIIIPQNYSIENTNLWITGICEKCNKH
ncbi:MAG: transcriptional repressor [Sphingobacteriales bacterium]|nr:transcriptional repressor [Sphingobacteriales bacterium]